MKLDPFLSSYTKITSKQIKDLDLKPEMQILLEENIRDTPEVRIIGKNFLNWNPTA